VPAFPGVTVSFLTQPKREKHRATKREMALWQFWGFKFDLGLTYRYYSPLGKEV
jgi:hypothetical protein